MAINFKFNYIANIACPCGWGKGKPCEAEKWEGELPGEWGEWLVLKVGKPENMQGFDQV